jgi:ribonuclease P protein component
VTVTFLADDAEHPPRVAYAVGTRVGSAVTRNRVRRRLRAGMAQRHQGPSGPLPSGDYLVGAGVGAVDCSWPELTAHLDRAVEAATAPPVPSSDPR